MAKRIDDSTIEKINELYLEYGVKARVARKNLELVLQVFQSTFNRTYIKKAG